MIELGLALLRGETVAPYNYVEQKAITADRAGRGLEADAGLAPVTAASKTGDEPASKRGRKAKESAGKKAK